MEWKSCIFCEAEWLGIDQECPNCGEPIEHNIERKGVTTMAKLNSKQKGKAIVSKWRKEYINEEGQRYIKKVAIRENKEVLMNQVYWIKNEYMPKGLERQELGWKLKGKIKAEKEISEYENTLMEKGFIKEA